MAQFKVTYIEPGANLWYVIPDSMGDIIVPVVATEVNDIYSHPDPNLGSIWRYRYEDGTDYIHVPTNQKDDEGWVVPEVKDAKWLADMKLEPVNQFVWIDEPVGHAIQVGDPWDGLYISLNEALKYARPSRKKHLKRRLRQSRASVHRFIKHTWKINGKDTHPGFKRRPDKKVIVRRR